MRIIGRPSRRHVPQFNNVGISSSQARPVLRTTVKTGRHHGGGTPTVVGTTPHYSGTATPRPILTLPTAGVNKSSNIATAGPKPDSKIAVNAANRSPNIAPNRSAKVATPSVPNPAGNLEVATSNRSAKVATPTPNPATKIDISTKLSNTRSISKCIGNYLLSKTIGQGAFGKVKLGIHVITGEKVAIKLLQKSQLVQAADFERTSREIKILKSNSHPNVIQLFEVLDTETTLYLVMEYCDGGEMFDYIVQHERLSEREAIPLFRQLLLGMEYLHETQQVTHRVGFEPQPNHNP